MSVLQVKAINAKVSDVYEDGDQYDVEGRIPEVGSRATFQDGRKFVFCSTDANLAAGDIVGTLAESVELTAVTAAYPVGTTVIGAVLAGVTADMYVGGTLTVSLGTGLGYTYKIKGNTASATVATVDNTVFWTLEEGIVLAMAATDNIIVKRDRNRALIQGTASLDNVGVVLTATTAATTGNTQYLWVQTGGLGLTKGTAGANGVALMATAAGAAIAQTAGKQIVANGVEAGASYSLCNLCFPE